MLTTLKTTSKKPLKPLQPLHETRSPSEHRFHSKEKFELECGDSFKELVLQYTTYGKLNADASNVIWVCHALTANANPAEWWPGLVGEKDIFNPDEHFIVCANVIGSAYGSTSPLNCEQEKRFRKFPLVTVRDTVNAWRLLRKHLGIESIHTLIGGSMGGHQALEWGIMEPQRVQHLILCATSAKTSPWVTAFNQSQRLAIEADKEYFTDHPEAGAKGLKAARSVALLSYRNDFTYNTSQSDHFDFDRPLKSTTYQNYQGEKLVKRFNAYSYYSLTRTMDSHDVSRSRGSIDTALRKVQAKTLVIGIETDLLFPIAESWQLWNGITGARFERINSHFGHDGFLIETHEIQRCIQDFYTREKDISLFGLGCVGQGFYHLLEKSGLEKRVSQTYVKNLNKRRELDLPIATYAHQKFEHNALGKTIVELTDDATFSWELLQQARAQGAHFITANKKMVASHLHDIINWNSENGPSIHYEAAVAGSIPILRNLNDHFQIGQNQSLTAILNGSSNYILTQMVEQNWSYTQALQQAQALGFAETNPYSDVSGEDAKFKAVILTAHTLGSIPAPKDILCLGIQNINSTALKFARDNQFQIKLVAEISRLGSGHYQTFVTPRFVNLNTELANTRNEDNFIEVISNDTKFLFKGAGAGSIATGSAVISDLHASDNNCKYQIHCDEALKLNYDTKVRIFISRNPDLETSKLGDIFLEHNDYYLIDSSLAKIKEFEGSLQENHFLCIVPEL